MLRFDNLRRVLLDNRGRAFDPLTRRWVSGQPEGAGEPVNLAAAVRWLQRESGAPCRVPVGVIGPREPTEQQVATALAVGSGLAGLGLMVLCGGREGVMEAVCRGVRDAGGLSIGLLPDEHWGAANPHVGVPIATGIGVARNAVIARASLALIAVGGGMGTLSEIAFGLQFGRPVFCLAGAPDVAGAERLPDWPALESAICRTVLDL